MMPVVPILVGATAAGASFQAWTVDPLTKVFREDGPVVSSAASTDVARGEVATWQVVVRASEPVDGLKVGVSALTGEGSTKLDRPRIRAVGYVPVDKTMAEPASDVLRKPPFDFPDPLMETLPTHLKANESQPFWIDVAVPPSAEPGKYRTVFTINAGGRIEKIPLELVVHPATVGKARLWVTNWFFTGTGHMPGAGKPGSKEEDAYLKLLAKRMAEHRQNVALINPLELAKFAWDKDGQMTADFSRFDDWVRIFIRAGVIGRIEGGHLGGRIGDEWMAQFVVNIKTPQGPKQVAPDSPEAEAFYARYLPLLVAHLKKRGWLDRYLQHLADEPIDQNASSYLAMAALVRKHAPELKTIEATHTAKVAGAVDVWVPQLNFAHTGYDFYRERQAKGDEFWTYTCVWPEGEYANRFIELPLVKTRLLHWINYRYGITGYLHWGYNYWVPDDPFDDVTRTKAKDGWGGFLPAGDSWIVYPKDGRLLDSIRYETMRDGIADHELLAMLGEKDADAAQRLASKLVLAFNRYDTDVAMFRTVRRELLSRL